MVRRAARSADEDETASWSAKRQRPGNKNGDIQADQSRRRKKPWKVIKITWTTSGKSLRVGTLEEGALHRLTDTQMKGKEGEHLEFIKIIFLACTSSHK